MCSCIKQVAKDDNFSINEHLFLHLQDQLILLDLTSVNPVHNAPRRSPPTWSFAFPTPVHFHLLRPLEPHPHPLPPSTKKIKIMTLLNP